MWPSKIWLLDMFNTFWGCEERSVWWNLFWLCKDIFLRKDCFWKTFEIINMHFISFKKENCFTDGFVENFQVFQNFLILLDSIDRACLSTDRKEEEKKPSKERSVWWNLFWLCKDIFLRKDCFWKTFGIINMHLIS